MEKHEIRYGTAAEDYVSYLDDAMQALDFYTSREDALMEGSDAVTILIAKTQKDIERAEEILSELLEIDPEDGEDEVDAKYDELDEIAVYIEHDWKHVDKHDVENDMKNLGRFLGIKHSINPKKRTVTVWK